MVYPALYPPLFHTTKTNAVGGDHPAPRRFSHLLQPTRRATFSIPLCLPCVKGGVKTAGFDGGIVRNPQKRSKKYTCLRNTHPRPPARRVSSRRTHPTFWMDTPVTHHNNPRFPWAFSHRTERSPVYLEESPEPSAANRQAPKVFTSFVVRAFCARRCRLSHILNPWIGQPRRRSLPSPSRSNVPRTLTPSTELPHRIAPAVSCIEHLFVYIYCRPVFHRCQ